MKIIFCSREFPPETLWGGEAVACRDMAQIFASFGHDVHVICQSVTGQTVETEDHGVTVHRIGTNNKRYSIIARMNYTWYAVSELLKITKRHENCVVNGFYSGTEVFVYSVLKLLGIRQQRLIIHAHGSIRYLMTDTKLFGILKNYLTLRILLWTADFTARRSDMIIAISKQIQNELINKTHVSPTKIRLLLTPRDNKKYIFTPSDLRKELGIEQESKVILAVGRLEDRKGVQIICSTIPMITKRFPKAVFVFIGSDTPFSPVKGCSYKQYLIDRIIGKDLSSVKFLSGVTDEYLIKAYSIADVVVSASLNETSTSVPLEAMACGKPVIVTDTGNARLMELDGTNGLIIPPGDVKALGKAIEAMLSLTPSQYKEISNRNVQIIADMFSYSQWVEEFRAVSNDWASIEIN